MKWVNAHGQQSADDVADDRAADRPVAEPGARPPGEREGAAATETAVTQSRSGAGESVIVSSGRIAPTVNATIDAKAACQGLVRSSGSMPSSTSACAASASCSVSSTATCRASGSLMPFSM